MIGLTKKAKAVPAPVAPPSVEPATATPAEQAARVEAELRDARADLAAAESELGGAQADYSRAADAAEIAKAVEARARITAAEVGIDVTRRAVERLQGELSPLLDGLTDAAALAERESLRAAGEAAAAAYETAFREHMPAIIAQSRELVRLWAVAELAREAAGAKGIALPRPDAFRDDPGTPRVEVGRRERDLWLNPHDGAPYDDRRQEQVRRLPDGSGSLVGANHTTRIDQKRRFVETTFRPATPGRLAPLLAEQMLIPAMSAGDPVGWAKPDGRYGFSTRAVLEALDALAAPRPAPAEPAMKTEIKPSEPARDVAVQSDVPRIPLLRSM